MGHHLQSLGTFAPEDEGASPRLISDACPGWAKEGSVSVKIRQIKYTYISTLGVKSLCFNGLWGKDVFSKEAHCKMLCMSVCVCVSIWIPCVTQPIPLLPQAQCYRGA